MEQYLIEIKNASQDLVTLTCPAKAPLLLVPGNNGRVAERVALTSEQFLSMAYDLEGFVDGKHGVKKMLELYVTDRVTGQCEDGCPFELGRMVAEGGFSADTSATAAQAEQEAKIDAQRKKANESAKPTDTNTLAGAMQAGLSGLK